MSALNPVLNEGVFVFCTQQFPSDLVKDAVIGCFQEKEGTTMILQKGVADQFQLDYAFEAAWITLGLNSELDMVGLTARFSSAMAEKGISANVIAGYYHDHIFVPYKRREEALKILEGIEFQ